MNRTRTLALAALGVVSTLALAACGSSSTPAATDVPTTAASPQQGYTNGPGQGGQTQRFPGTTGKVAEVDGKTLQVQGSSGQTAVTYSASTVITAQVSGSLKDVKVGSCVTVTPTSSSSSSSGTSSSTVTAASVRITAATGGSCTGGFGGTGAGFGGTRPSGAPSFNASDRPSFNPSDRPSGFGGGQFRTVTAGKVTAVSGSGFTVAATRVDLSSGSSPSTTTSDVTVKVGSSTTYTATQKAGSSALKVGTCVTAIGSANDVGAVAARTIAVSAPVSGSCTTGFGGGAFGGTRG